MMRRYGLFWAWLIAALGTLISLYWSEGLHLEPCHLCWYQRICLFPLVIILWIAGVRGFIGIVPYVLPQVLLGAFIALYQIGIQEIPGWEPIHLCGAGPSCAEKLDIGLGPITIPMLSLAGFVLIALFLLGAWISDAWERRRERKEENARVSL